MESKQQVYDTTSVATTDKTMGSLIICYKSFSTINFPCIDPYTFAVLQVLAVMMLALVVMAVVGVVLVAVAVVV
jgi:hypothetical protein